MENLQQHNKRLRLSFSEYTEKLINKLELESFSYGDGRLIELTKENANKIKEYLKKEEIDWNYTHSNAWQKYPYFVYYVSFGQR